MQHNTGHEFIALFLSTKQVMLSNIELLNQLLPNVEEVMEALKIDIGNLSDDLILFFETWNEPSGTQCPQDIAKKIESLMEINENITKYTYIAQSDRVRKH